MGNMFNDKDDVLLVEEASKLFKRECKTVDKYGRKYILCGTDLVYEDDVCDRLYKTISDLCKTFGFESSFDEYCDDISELRDKVLESVLMHNNAHLVIGSEEY